MKENLYKIVSKIVVSAALMLMVIAVLTGFGRKEKEAEETGKYQRPYPMPHQYWYQNDEYYVFASGGQQGGIFVYTIPTMKLLSEIPVFKTAPNWGWTLANPEVEKLLTNPYTGEVGVMGDSHHPALSRKNALYDGRWLFINDKVHARVAMIDLSSFRTVEMLWIPNVNGGAHGLHTSPNSDLVVTNIELEQYPDKKIIDYLGLDLDFVKGPYVSTVVGIDVAENGSMSNAWQVWGPWQYDMVRIGWGETDGWIVNTTYNTERATDLIGMFSKPDDYIFLWNIASIRRAIEEGKYITTDEAPNVPVISWKDVEVYAVPCPTNPHGVDVAPGGRYLLSSGKATTIVRMYDFTKIKQAIEQKQFADEDFGVPVIDNELVAVDIDAGLGPTHIDFDNRGFAYVAFFVDSDIKKITLGEPWTEKHGMEPARIVEEIPVHYSVGHLMVTGGDTAEPYGDYLISLNKLTKDTFAPHGPLYTENHELFDIKGDRARLVDQMPLPPETHYAQAIPINMIAPNVKTVYREAPEDAESDVGVEYDYTRKEVIIKMNVVRSFYNPDHFTVPEGWKVRIRLTSLESVEDISHGFALTGHDIIESLDPGEVKEVVFTPKEPGVFWYYCIWFCSELHLEMRGRMIVVPENQWNRSMEWTPPPA